jgi:hypothetical protein
MFANKIKISVSSLIDATATTINIPLTMEYQNIDQSELVNRVFVDVETEKAINPIIDYEKTRFIPLNNNGKILNKVIYNLDLNGATTYGDASVGFTDVDIKFKKEVFKQTFLNLEFYDTSNPLTQNLVSVVTLFSKLNDSDLNSSSASGLLGQPKPANEIKLTFKLENELYYPRGYTEGFYLYNYKDEVKLNDSKYLYMKATFKNAKIGISTNLMVKNSAQPIDSLVNELYTRYKLVRNTNGFYYVVDEQYQGNAINSGTTNNVTYNYVDDSVLINLFQTKAL